MRYELKIGWRYLYSGKQDRTMMLLAAGAAAVSLGGLAILLQSSGNALGVLMFVLGMILAAFFALMSAFSVFTSVSVFGVALGVAASAVRG